MKAIETRYLPATARKGSRIVASDSDGNRATISYPSELKMGEACHLAAARELCRKKGWLGDLIGAQTKHGFTFMLTTLPDTRHNGWRNYETWIVWVWMDNERGVKDGWIKLAGEIVSEAIADKSFSRDERATLDLSDSLKESFESKATIGLGVGFTADLLNAALSEVDWREIAQELVSLVKKEAA